MISDFTIFACVVSLCASVVLPILVMIFYARRHRGCLGAWLLGAAGFVVPQMMIRLPILNVLSGSSGFLAFAQSHPLVYGLGLAFTAGLFELAGRLASAKLLEKKLDWNRTLALGMGHGGSEAILLVGTAYINNLVYLFMLRAGTFDGLVANAGAAAAQLEAVRMALLTTPGWMFLLAGVERLLTMICHAAMSSMVCLGVHRKKVLPWALGCLAFHTLLDSAAALTLVMPQERALPLIYGALAVLTVCAGFVIRYVKAHWEDAQ